MTKLTTVVHHEWNEQLFFTWLWCGYHELIRQAHDLTIHLDKRRQQTHSPFLAYHEAGRYLWQAITRLPKQAKLDDEPPPDTTMLARLAKKTPLFLLIYQGLWLENRLTYAQEAASAALLFYVCHEQAPTSHHSFMQLHTQLSQWIMDTIQAQQIHDTQIKSLILFYFHDYTAKNIQAHQTLPQPPVITTLKNELMALCEDSKQNGTKLFGNFSKTALDMVSAICQNQQHHHFLMTFLDAIARAYVYVAYRNTMEEMLACEQKTLLKFLFLPALCSLGLIASLFFEHNTPLLLLQLSACYYLTRNICFFFLSHAFDHYCNGGELVRYLQHWTPGHSEEGFLYWQQALYLDTTALLPPPEKIISTPPSNTPEYWYAGNYTRVIYHHLRALTPAQPKLSNTQTIITPEKLTWTIDGMTYHTDHVFAIDQPNLPANAPTAYFAAMHPNMRARPDTQPFQRLLEGRLRFVGETGAGVKMLQKHQVELKTVGREGKNDTRMLSDPQAYPANERTTARLWLFSQAPINHAQVKKHLSSPPVLR